MFNVIKESMVNLWVTKMSVFLDPWFIFFFMGLVFTCIGIYIYWSTSTFGKPSNAYLELIFTWSGLSFFLLSFIHLVFFIMRGMNDISLNK